MKVTGKRGRPPANPPAQRTMNNELSSSSSNNYKNISLFPKESIDGDNNGHGDGRRRKKNDLCTCSFCSLVGTEIIKTQYSKADSILIEDRSKRIFNPLFERCPN